MDIIIGKDNIEADEYLKQPENYRFWLKSDDVIKNYKQFKKKYELHLNVLPHPFFGEIDNPDILFLAGNPSYADYYEDELDTYLYLRNNNNNLDNYVDNLKKANFFKEWNCKENISFISSWKWWNSRILGKVKLRKGSNPKIGFINLCGYQSKSYSEKHFKTYGVEEVFNAIEKATVIVVVWKCAFESGEIKDEIKNKPHLVLTEGNIGANVNSLEKIIKGQCEKKYLDEREKDAISILKVYFEPIKNEG